MLKYTQLRLNPKCKLVFGKMINTKEITFNHCEADYYIILARQQEEGGMSMPGYVVHNATGRKDMMINIPYQKGLNAPDYFKRINTKEDFDKYFKYCQKGTCPKYEEFLELKSASSNFHFGYSSDPDIKKFVKLPFVDISKPFWKGYLTHLIGDKEVYSLENGAVDMKKFRKEGSNKSILHKDWDKINKKLQEKYDIQLLPEIMALGIINYVEGDTTYVNSDNLIKVIEKIRHMSDKDIYNYLIDL